MHVRVVSLQRGAPEANFCCYLQEFVKVRAVLLERGAPQDNFCCYLQGFGDPQGPRKYGQEMLNINSAAAWAHFSTPKVNFCCYLHGFVGVKAVSLERGAPQSNFYCYLQGFGNPSNSRPPGAPGGSWELLGALTGHVPTPILPDPNPTGRIPTQLARDTFPPNSHGTRSHPNQVNRQTGSQADSQTYRHTHMQQMANK